MPRELSEGIYEHLVTEEVAHAIGGSAPLIAVFAPVADADVPLVLGRHVGNEIARVLDGLSREGRAAAASVLAGQILDDLATRIGGAEELREQRPAPPLRRLLPHRTVPANRRVPRGIPPSIFPVPFR